MSDDADSLLTYAGVGSVAACCLALELLGGAVVLGGLAAMLGLSEGLTYLVVLGVSGALVALLAIGYHQFQTTTHV
ncbi:MAG: hypothetical protein M8354_10790 [Halalkalicoccus sp.]|nr:hypothetical protein [Halalkalicoccus sp.]